MVLWPLSDSSIHFPYAPRHWAHCHGATVGTGPVPVVIVPVGVAFVSAVVPSVVGLGDVGWQFNGQTRSALQSFPSTSTLHPQKYASSWNWIGCCHDLNMLNNYHFYPIKVMDSTTIIEMNIVIISWATSVIWHFSSIFWKWKLIIFEVQFGNLPWVIEIQ